MKQRVITAIFFVVAMLGGVYGGASTFLILFAIVAAGCTWELFGLLLSGEERYRMLRQVAGVAVTVGLFVLLGGDTLGFWQLRSQAETFMVLFIPLFGATALLELFLNGKEPFRNIGLFLLAVAYIALPLVLLAGMATHRMGWCGAGESEPVYSPYRVFGLLLLIWTNDTMAYFVGSQLGKNKLFERISPKKTWEGTIGGGICTMLIAWGLSFLINDFTPAQWIALAAVAAVFGTLGDLVESMLKRSVGVKDSGNLLPGHGGLLDRFDAFIFALPFYYMILQTLQD